jgi:hypothetical protein
LFSVVFKADYDLDCHAYCAFHVLLELALHFSSPFFSLGDHDLRFFFGSEQVFLVDRLSLTLAILISLAFNLLSLQARFFRAPPCRHAGCRYLSGYIRLCLPDLI